MIDLDEYLQKLISGCRALFGERLRYVGLQGSYLRGEAGEQSDIDIMVILDRFSVQDMDMYKELLGQIGHADKACGFICGLDEITRWNPLEVCQLRHTTKDLCGKLDDYLPPASRTDEINYVKLSLGNLYHEICHRYIHTPRENSVRKLRGACKSLFYIIQNLHYLESGRFVLAKAALKQEVPEEDRRVLALADLPDGFDFDAAFSALFSWCQRALIRADRLQGD